MKRFDITADKILNVMLVVIVSFGIYMCGWINGNISAHDTLNTYKEVEYIYITEPCFEEHVTDIPEETSENASIEPVEAPEWPKLYSDEDAVALAKTVWGEARGVKDNGIVSGDCQRAAVVWCVLNRYDAGFEDSIFEVITAEDQFHGYRADYPVEEDLLELVYDVLDRWNAEQHGEIDVGRVLPAEYMWFGGDGNFNRFRDAWKGGNKWDWSLADPYAA